MDSHNAKKTKITLSDYNYKKDIENRMVMASLTASDLRVLEELLYSPITTTLKRLAENLEFSEDKLKESLTRLKATRLFKMDAEQVVTDKEMRKYFEAQMTRFEEDFKPGMEYFQTLLKKVPIHILPTWYAIPRTSNNILESIIEKYLITPQVFQRYLSELVLEPIDLKIMNKVYASDNLKIPSKEIIEALQLTRDQFEEHLLLLEFSFVCCIHYEKEGDQFVEYITPFQEWKDYLMFLKNTEVKPISDYKQIQRTLPEDLSFVKDMGNVLQMAKKEPLPLDGGSFLPEFAKKAGIEAKSPAFIKSYFERLIAKLELLKLADIEAGLLKSSSASDYFLEMKPESRSLYLYRHPTTRNGDLTLFVMPVNEKMLRECEKTVVRILDKGWVFYEDFELGVLAPLSEGSQIILKKVGKNWRYNLPSYTTTEKAFIKQCLLDWLYEVGIIAKGLLGGSKECITITGFGSTIFSR